VRRGEDGGEEGALAKDVGSRTNDRTVATYMLSSSSRRLMASCTVESHRCAAAMRSLSESKVWVVYVSTGSDRTEKRLQVG